MLVLGAALSQPTETWLEEGERNENASTRMGDAQALQGNGIDVARGTKPINSRIDGAVQALRGELKRANIETLVIIGDPGSVFGEALSPILAVYCGGEVSGGDERSLSERARAQNGSAIGCDTVISKQIANGLVAREFDVAVSYDLQPFGDSKLGLGSAFTDAVHALGAVALGIAIVPVFLRGGNGPLPSVQRCLRLGHCIYDILGTGPKRVALFGLGPKSWGSIPPFGRWSEEGSVSRVSDGIAEGRDEEALSSLLANDPSSRGGFGELQSWIAVTGAFAGSDAVMTEHIPHDGSSGDFGYVCWRVG